MKEENIIQLTPAVAILTNFSEFNPGYSLTGIVVDQAHMLAREGHKVIIYVSEQYNPKYEDDSGLSNIKRKYPNQIIVKNLTKFMHLVDYQSQVDLSIVHKEQADEAARIYADDFESENIKAIYTHDFIFTGWNLPFSLAIKGVNSILALKNIYPLWYHWVHSVPSQNRDWWDLNEYGNKHFIVFPNKTEIMRVAEAFKTKAERVKIIPHIKDIRTWYDFGDDAFGFTENYPYIMKANIVQVYPCSTDRLKAKQLEVLIKIFGNFKKYFNMDVFLVAANQWATCRQRKEDVNEYIKIAEQCGLVPGIDFVFTSEYKEKFAVGIPKRMLRELQQLSNLFIFPTREESFGLVGPEASYSGALSVTNKSLQMMSEVMSSHPPSFDFGSFSHNPALMSEENIDNYLIAVSRAIAQRMFADESVMTKLYCQKRYNMDSIYSNYYLPSFY